MMLFKVFIMDQNRAIRFLLVILQIAFVKARNFWNVTCPQNCTCNYATSLYHHKSLKTIDCSGSGMITAHQTSMDINYDTQVLILRNKNLEKLPKFLTPLANIDRDKNLDKLPKFLTPLANVEQLDLSRNLLTLKYENFNQFPGLLYLNLTRNSISVLNHGVFRALQSLEVLDLSYNSISTIKSDAFKGIKFLYKIYLSNNLLETINSNWFPSVIYLRELYLDYNNITSIKRGDFGVKEFLDTLSIAGNRISTFEQNTFKGITKLRTLNISYNNFLHVPNTELTRTSLPFLRYLTLDGNPIKRIRQNDFSSSNLIEIDICDMPELRLLEAKSFNRLNYLTVLRLNGNPKLFFIDRLSFYKLSNLQRLYVNDNHLMGVSEDVITLAPSLLEVHLYNNPLRCDCNIHWVKQLLLMAVRFKNISNIIKFPRSDDITCYNPFNWTLLHLNNVPMSNLSPVCTPTGIPLFSDNIQIEVGSDLSLECHSMGLPSPQMTWILPDGTTLNQSNSRVDLSDITFLFLSNIQDREAGTYACMVSNIFGYDISSTMVRVHTTTIKVKPIGISKHFIRLTWSGSGTTVKSSKYRVLCIESKTHRVIRELRLTPYMRHFTVSKLTPDTTYEFCIGYEHNNRWNLINCRNVTTLHSSYDSGGIIKINKTNVIVGITCSILTVILLIIVVMFCKSKKKKDYNSNNKPNEVQDTMVQIPLTTMSFAPPTPLCTSRTSLLAASQTQI